MSIKSLLAISALFLFSCASMKDVERISSREVVHLWKYYKGEEVSIKLNLEGKRPLEYRPSRFVKIKVGSHFDGKAIHPRKESFLKIEDEDYGTDY